MYRHRSSRRPRGQVIPITALAMIALIGGVALILEGGNAYAHQREAQNGSDAVANAGATVLAQYLGGTTKSDADVVASMNSVSNANFLNDYDGYYTDVTGQWLTPGGAITTSQGAAARVGDGLIPPGAQGVQALGTQTFATTFGRVIGFPQFTASADAISVAGALAGGGIMPLVFPVNIVDCETNGDLGTGETSWQVSNPPTTPGGNPVGQEYIVPLCKTGGGSFMILDLDGTMNNCDDEVANPPAKQFASFPVIVQSDNGNNCANLMDDEFNARSGQVVLIPVCDGDCTTTGGSHATYHIIRVAAFFVDYFSDQNNGINAACVGNGTTLVPIAGNGSSSCIAGWFVRYITSGPVTGGPVQGAGAIGVQLVK
jgi:putative Flp pilus-assembly TadE/G-like protein